MLRIFLALWLAITPAFAWAGSMMLTGVGTQTSAAPATTTWNPATKDSGVGLSGGNLIATQNDSFAFDRFLGIASHSSGKFYYEFTLTNLVGNQGFVLAGIANANAAANNAIGSTNDSVGANGGGGVALNGSSFATWTGSLTNGDVWGVAVDLTAQLIWFNLNGGAWNAGGTANPATGVGGYSFSTMNAGPYFPGSSFVNGGTIVTGNFGGSAYAHTAPGGFGNW